jgi:signal transduction histidine kinase
MTLQRTLDGTPIATLEINNDITELKRYAERLEDLVEERTAQLKDAERLAGIGETAAMIGHDLRNPLQGLQYIVDLQKLRFERVPPEERGANDWKNEEGLFDRISEQVFYMDKIVADLQDYARPIAPELEKVAISTLINDVRASLPRTDHVKIISDVSDLVMTVDPHLVHRVFANLILNAIQAMPDGGTLTISASRFDNSVAINVHDTGVGIPEEMKDKLFLPLCTGKAKGTGLGLAVVKRVIDAHGGTITFESVEGEGTTFTVTLPAKVNEGAFDDWSC